MRAFLRHAANAGFRFWAKFIQGKGRAGVMVGVNVDPDSQVGFGEAGRQSSGEQAEGAV